MSGTGDAVDTDPKGFGKDRVAKKNAKRRVLMGSLVRQPLTNWNARTLSESAFRNFHSREPPRVSHMPSRTKTQLAVKKKKKKKTLSGWYALLCFQDYQSTLVLGLSTASPALCVCVFVCTSADEIMLALIHPCGC